MSAQPLISTVFNFYLEYFRCKKIEITNRKFPSIKVASKQVHPFWKLARTNRDKNVEKTCLGFSKIPDNFMNFEKKRTFFILSFRLFFLLRMITGIDLDDLSVVYILIFLYLFILINIYGYNMFPILFGKIAFVIFDTYLIDYRV